MRSHLIKIVSLFILLTIFLHSNAHAHCKIYKPIHCAKHKLKKEPAPEIGRQSQEIIGAPQVVCADAGSGKTGDGSCNKDKKKNDDKKEGGSSSGGGGLINNIKYQMQ